MRQAAASPNGWRWKAAEHHRAGGPPRRPRPRRPTRSGRPPSCHPRADRGGSGAAHRGVRRTGKSPAQARRPAWRRRARRELIEALTAWNELLLRAAATPKAHRHGHGARMTSAFEPVAEHAHYAPPSASIQGRHDRSWLRRLMPLVLAQHGMFFIAVAGSFARACRAGADPRTWSARNRRRARLRTGRLAAYVLALHRPRLARGAAQRMSRGCCCGPPTRSNTTCATSSTPTWSGCRSASTTGCSPAS